MSTERLRERVEHLRALAADDSGATPSERENASRALAIHEAKLAEASAGSANCDEPWARFAENLSQFAADLGRVADIISKADWFAAARTVGPELTRRGGPFPAREHDGRVWVAARAGEVEARAWVADRRRMMVKIHGGRRAMIPTAIEIDEERQQVHVSAVIESLTDW